jgi:hypothetical protein
MFAKEFHFDEVLQIWDFIIAAKKNFVAMDMVALAMIVWARDFGNKDIVKGESFEVLQILAKVSYKGNAKCILFLAKKFFGYAILNQLRDKYLLPTQVFQ